MHGALSAALPTVDVQASCCLFDKHGEKSAF